MPHDWNLPPIGTQTIRSRFLIAVIIVVSPGTELECWSAGSKDDAADEMDAIIREKAVQ